MYRHSFWCAFRNISIAAVSLLAQCTEYFVRCPHRHSRKICFIVSRRILNRSVVFSALIFRDFVPRLELLTLFRDFRIF